MRRDNAVGSVGAGHVKIAVLKAALALVNHIKCFGLVLLHRSHMLSQAWPWLPLGCRTELPGLRLFRAVVDLSAKARLRGPAAEHRLTTKAPSMSLQRVLET